MHHPFALNLTDLESLNLNFVDEITMEEAARVNGGNKELTDCYVTGTLGIGVRCTDPKAAIKPIDDQSLKKPKTPGKIPPEATTQVVGEGGDTTLTTQAVGEEGGTIGGKSPVK